MGTSSMDTCFPGLPCAAVVVHAGYRSGNLVCEEREKGGAGC